jgi:hypothetical protein
MMISETGALPMGVAFTDNHNGTATINGTPAAGTQGTMGTPVSQGYPLTIGADNGIPPAASQAFTLNITCPGINVTSAPTAGNLSLTFNSAMATNTYSETNGNGTIGWTITGQPNGLSIGGANGQLTGTPSQTGTFSATVTATDAGGCTGTKAVTIAVKPVATADSYPVGLGLVDNTQFVVAGGTTGNPMTPFVTTNGMATFRLTNNDLPSGGITLTSTGTFATSAGGSVTIAADGTFIYTPKANPTLAAVTVDSFTYTISSDTGGTGTATTAQGTATLTLTGRVWYVLNNVTLTGNGQSQSPFKTLAEAIAASTSNDVIFVYRGDGTTTGLGAAALKTGQALLGQGVALVVNGNALVAAGSTPLIGGTVTLNTNTTARGFNLSTAGNTGMNDPVAAITGVTVNTVSVTTTTGTGVLLNGTTGTLSFTGVTTTTGTGVNLSNIGSGSSLTFTGLTTTGGPGATLTATNTGATFSFSGVSVSSGANTGFNATGGGTLTITGANNTLTSTTGTALNVANTTIGASGLTFKSISAGAGTNGIVLNTTGSSGGLTITGDGSTAGSGGSIHNMSSDAISLTSTANVSLSFMNVSNNTHSGIAGNSVNNFSLISSSLQTNGTVDTLDNGVKLTDTTGTVTFTSDNIAGSHASNVWLTNSPSSTAVITTLTVTGGSYNNTVNGTSFLSELHGSSSVNTALISGVTFSGNKSMGLNLVHNDSGNYGNGVGAPATGTATVINCIFTNNNGLGVSFAAGGGNGTGSMYVRFVGNVMTGTNSHAINIVSGATSTAGTQKVLIDNNCIGMSGATTGTTAGHCGTTPGPANSGSTLGEGIVVTQQGKNLGTVTITNNFIRNLANGAGGFGNRVIDVQSLGPVATGQAATPFNVVITGNNVDSGFTGTFPQAAIYLGVDDQGSPTTMNAAIHGNTVPNKAGCEGNNCGPNSGMIFYDEVMTASTGTLFNFSGSGANVSSEIANTNTGTAGKTCAVDLAHLTLTNTPVPVVN